MSNLTPDLADKVLGANLRNIVKKVGDGGTLTPAEMEIMERAKLDGSLNEELLRARRAALLRRFASGGRLNADEQAEIATIIPPTQAVVKKVTSEAYKLTLREYAEQFQNLGMDPSKDAPRKLKHWVKHGREDKHGNLRDEPDLPPFDQPSELATWWRRNMTYKPPDWMVALEKDTAIAKRSDAPKGETPASSAPPTDPKQPTEIIAAYGELQLEGEVAKDLTVRILAGAVKDALRRYDDARQRGIWKEARIILEELIDLVKALQRAQVDAIKLLAAQGDYLEAKKTMASLNEVFAMLDTSFTNGLDAVVRQVAPHLDADQRREIVMPARDQVFGHLHRTQFAEAWKPEDAAHD